MSTTPQTQRQHPVTTLSDTDDSDRDSSTARRVRSGPLKGIKILELAGIGPAPFACMMLADAGAQVLRLERAPGGAVEAEEKFANAGFGSHWDLLNRSRPSVGINLKDPDAVELVLDLVEQADGLIEGFRPGVAERLGLGPEACFARNKRLVYGRMTGWGQDGPMAPMAGHDIDYIAIAGALWALGRADSAPVPPLNLVGDFGGGGMFLAFGVLAALLEAKHSNKGQVVDTAMVDGAASLMTMIYAFRASGVWSEERGANLFDTGAPFYEVYETSDGKWMAVGSYEPQFYVEVLKILGLEDDASFLDQMAQAEWPAMKARFAEIFRTKTRDEWAAFVDGTDACIAPVLSPWEAPLHPHNVARSTFVEVEGVVQPAPAPRFSRTPSAISKPPSAPGADTISGLAEWGIPEDTVRKLRESGALSWLSPRPPGTGDRQATSNSGAKRLNNPGTIFGTGSDK
jgi:alpha-methylacyl-CoA racemase